MGFATTLHPPYRLRTNAKMAGLVGAGCGSNTYLGRIIVDDDIDITNPAEVMRAVATR